MNENSKQEIWSENVILADADYVDRVAFDLIVNFERMLERPIPQADLARWIDCVALDGGLRPAPEEQGADNTEHTGTQVILLHDKAKSRLENFAPGHFADELDGKAFSDQLGEFTISCIPVEQLTTMEELFCESLQHISRQAEVKRLMAVCDEQYYDRIKATLNNLAPREHTTTVFTMQPVPGGRFQQEVLGFSLMAALGIRGEEVAPPLHYEL